MPSRHRVGLAIATGLLLACFASQAEARAAKGPGKYRPRIADHYNAAHRMVYVAAQDEKVKPPAHEDTVITELPSQQPVPERRSGPPPPPASPFRKEELNRGVPAVPKFAPQLSKSAAAAASKVFTAGTLVSVAITDAGKHRLKSTAQSKSTDGGPTVADALTAAGDIPVLFSQPKPVDQQVHQFSTPKPTFSMPTSPDKHQQLVSTTTDKPHDQAGNGSQAGSQHHQMEQPGTARPTRSTSGDADSVTYHKKAADRQAQSKAAEQEQPTDNKHHELQAPAVGGSGAQQQSSVGVQKQGVILKPPSPHMTIKRVDPTHSIGSSMESDPRHEPTKPAELQNRHAAANAHNVTMLTGHSSGPATIQGTSRMSAGSLYKDGVRSPVEANASGSASAQLNSNTTRRADGANMVRNGTSAPATPLPSSMQATRAHTPSQPEQQNIGLKAAAVAAAAAAMVNSTKGPSDTATAPSGPGMAQAHTNTKAAVSSTDKTSSTGAAGAQAEPTKTATAQATESYALAAANHLPEDVSIFSVKKIRTDDGKIEVVVKPLPAIYTASHAAGSGLRPQSAAAGSPAAGGSQSQPGALAAAKACQSPQLSNHEADIAFTAGQNGVSVTTLSASCAAAAPALSTLGGGCSLKCDVEDDLARITLVAARNVTGAADADKPGSNADKPAVCSYQTTAVLKGKCKAVLKVACCTDSAAPVSVSSESISVSSGSSSVATDNATVISGAAIAPKINITTTNTDKPAGSAVDPTMQPLSVAQLLEQAAAAMQIKQQAAQALAFQQMQQLQAELLATQAKIAAMGARVQQQTSGQLQADMQKMGMLTSFGSGWSPLAMASIQQPTTALLQSLTPQFPAAAASQAAGANQLPAAGGQSSYLWSPVADYAATWRDSISQLMSTSKPWWPWSTAV